MAFDIDLSNQYIGKKGFNWSASNKNRLYMGLDINLLKHLSITGGVSYNLFHLDKNLLSDPDFGKIRPSYHHTYGKATDANTWLGWFGYKIGIRYSM